MSAFVNTDLLEIKVAYRQGTNGLVVMDPLEGQDKLKIKDLKNFELHSFYIRKPNWAITRDIAVDSTIISQEGRPVLVPALIADSRLRRVLVDWTLMHKEGEEEKKVPVSNYYIDKLDPNLVNYLVGKISELLDAEDATT